MFHWAQLLGLRPRPAPVLGHPTNDAPVRLLAVTPDDAFYSTLHELATARAWELVRATSVDEAVGKRLPLVLLDWKTVDDDWPDALQRLSNVPHHPCVLLASPVIDENVKQEVMRCRGYDVLARSAGRDELARGIQFAWFWATRAHTNDNGSGPKEARH